MYTDHFLRSAALVRPKLAYLLHAYKRAPWDADSESQENLPQVAVLLLAAITVSHSSVSP